MLIVWLIALKLVPHFKLAPAILPSSVMLAMIATESLKTGATGVLVILVMLGIILQKFPPGQIMQAYSG